MKLVECVPNFSEGCDAAVIEAISDAIKGISGVALLDVDPGKATNRTVYTFAGAPDDVLEAAFQAIKKGTSLIDMRKHKGEHARQGACDVCPFVPISDVTMAECVELSNRLAKRVGDELGIPVYLYAEAAKRPERKRLPDIRVGEYEALEEKLRKPEWKPDFGPAEVHPSAGASVFGAREYLIAFNINLATNDLKIANKIARAVRGSSGGYVNVKGMGVELTGRGIVQVSMNMTDFTKTPLYRVVELVRIEAKRYGVNIVGSEIVGLVPMGALVDAAVYYMGIESFSIEQVLEARLME